MTLVLRKTEHILVTTDIMLDWLTGDLLIEPSDGDHIVITQFAELKFPESKLFQLQQVDAETLSIVDGRKSWVHIGFNWHKTVLKIQLPKMKFRLIAIRHVGGQITAKQLHTKEFRCSTTSSQAKLAGRMEQLTLHATASQVTGHELEIGELDLRAISSKVELTGQFLRMNTVATGRSVAIRSFIVPTQVNSISTGAKVTVTIPENDGFVLHLKKRSGRFQSDFPLHQKENTYTYLNGINTYHAEVRGGSCALRK